MRSSLFLFAWCISSVLSNPTISKFPNSLSLSTSFDPIQAAYWTGLPHHRRTPLSVSPDGKTAYIAFLDSTLKNVVVQQVDVRAFTAVGPAVSIPAFEAAGLVVQNDGFALFATIKATGTPAPANDDHIAALIRYKNGVEAWRTPLNGPGVHAVDGVSWDCALVNLSDLEQLSATPDANGDLVYSEASGLYGAYFVVTAYSGDATGHFGDSIQYVDDNGSLQELVPSSTFGCSHNTGIAIEAADEAPFATVCAEDQGAIWLNTDTQYMSGVKIANENTTNGVSGEPMGGMSGSYSNLALFPNTTKYIFAWQSRGAVNLVTNTWLGAPYTQCSPRWLNHNVAIATMSTKNTLTGTEANSALGGDGDSQVNWITESAIDDHQNVRVAALNSNLALVSWETLTSPKCEPVPLSCSGTYAGTSFQFVDSTGARVGSVVTDSEVFVSGDYATINGKVCWPYVDMVWDLSVPKDSGTPVTKISFACVSNGPASETVGSSVSTTPIPASSVSSQISAQQSATGDPATSRAESSATMTSDPASVTSSSEHTALTSLVDAEVTSSLPVVATTSSVEPLPSATAETSTPMIVESSGSSISTLIGSSAPTVVVSLASIMTTFTTLRIASTTKAYPIICTKNQVSKNNRTRGRQTMAPEISRPYSASTAA